MIDRFSYVIFIVHHPNIDGHDLRPRASNNDSDDD